MKTRCDGVEDCGGSDSSDELNCNTLYWGDQQGAYAKEKPPKPTDIGEGSKVKGLHMKTDSFLTPDSHLIQFPWRPILKQSSK